MAAKLYATDLCTGPVACWLHPGPAVKLTHSTETGQKMSGHGQINLRHYHLPQPI